MTALYASLFEHEVPRIAEWIEPRSIDLSRHKQEALEEMRRSFPGADLSVIDARVGYAQDGARLRAVAEVMLQADQGGFIRRFVQAVDL